MRQPAQHPQPRAALEPARTAGSSAARLPRPSASASGKSTRTSPQTPGAASQDRPAIDPTAAHSGLPP
eukprot:4868320-Alexandrium_andersonii.AAC.1